jgi:hypothetical protein
VAEEDQRRRSTVAEARRRWRLEWSGGSSTVTVGRGVNGFSSRPTVRGRVHGRWLHVQRVERRWRLVSSVGRQRRLEVAGGRAAVVHAGRQRPDIGSECCTRRAACVARGGGRQLAAVGTAAARRAVALRVVGIDNGAVGMTHRRARARENG